MPRDLLAEKRQPKDLLAGKRQPVDLLAGRKPPKASFMEKFGNAGIGYGAESVKRGLSLKDAPHIAAKAVSGVFQGLPERVAENPIKTALAGPMGASVAFSKPEQFQLPSPIPKAQSEGGEMIGKSAELVTSSLPVGGVSKPILKMRAVKPRGLAVRGDQLKAKTLAEELQSGIEKSRDVVGKAQGDYIDANASALIDDVQFQNLLKKLPPDLAEEVASNQAISRQAVGGGVKTSFDPMGIALTENVPAKQIVSPTLKNAQTIRGLIKEEVPSRHFKPSLLDEQSKNLVEGLYDEVGKLMREGRPDLAEKMKNYADVMQARAEVLPQLKSKTGFTKARPILRMFDDNAEITGQQAVRRLAQYNPEIDKTVEGVRKLGSSIKVKRGLDKNARRLGAAMLAGGALKKGWDFFQ